MPFDLGSFGGGLGSSLEKGMTLKKLMMQAQQPPQMPPQMPPGYEDPNLGMSVAGPGDFNPPSLQPQPRGMFGSIEDLMKRLLGG